MFNFQILPDSVKKLLVPLRYGDQLSIVHYNKVTEEINSTEKEFIDNYLSEPNIEEYITITRKNKGIIIQLLGTSFSGKKTFAKKLIEIFGSDKIIYIYSNQNNIIADCLNAINTGKIVIINILISQYLDIVKQLPEIIKNSYKINFWCFRNKLMYCDDILDINLQEQIKLYGNCNIYNPFQNDLDWKKLISCTEERNSKTNYFYYKSDISLTIGWNYCIEHVINHIINYIIKIYNYNNSIIY